MALYRRGSTWWIGFTTPNGRRIRQSTGTKDRKAAQELHDGLRAEAWRVFKLGERPRRLWKDAVKRWLRESSERATIDDMKLHLRWLHAHLFGKYLDEIDRDCVDRITEARQADNVSNATVNRMLEVVRAILRCAQNEWGWIDVVPAVRMLKEPKGRVRWLTHEEADRLIAELPTHLAEMVRFTLATGLRQANVRDLEWTQIDWDNDCACIPADRMKNGKALNVSLSSSALSVLRRQRGKHPVRVFTFESRPIKQVRTKAWVKALGRARIEDFRWHDLRHTWASWHIQQGTSLLALKAMGGWRSMAMVDRYAHLAPSDFAKYAEKLYGPCLLGSVPAAMTQS